MLTCIACQPSEKKAIAAPEIRTEPEIHSLKIMFVGDLMNHSPQTKAAYNAQNRTYNYDSCFVYVDSILQSADLCIGNLEFPFAGPPYTGYPMFSGPDAYATALKNAGFDLLLCANNHSCDKKLKGLVRTLDLLDSLGLKHSGTYRDSAERAQNYPTLIEQNEIKIALLNATYGTNGLPIPYPSRVNLLDSVELKNDFARARNMQADLIIMTVHWGLEYQRYPNEEQKKWADFFIREGAGLVVGSHPHVVQTYERRQGVPVIYSLGNFISNQRDKYKDGGIIYEISLLKKEGKTQIASHAFHPVWVQKQMHPKLAFRLIPPNFEADTLLGTEEKKRYKDFLNYTRNHFRLD